jgi:hypothetical protein
VDEEGEECPRAVNNPAQHVRRPRKAAGRLTDAAVADRRGIGFGWLQNAWLLHARLNILTRGARPRVRANTENPRAGSLRLLTDAEKGTVVWRYQRGVAPATEHSHRARAIDPSELSSPARTGPFAGSCWEITVHFLLTLRLTDGLFTSSPGPGGDTTTRGASSTQPLPTSSSATVALSLGVNIGLSNPTGKQDRM